MPRLARFALVALSLLAPALALADELPHYALTPPALTQPDEGGGEGVGRGQGSYLSGRTIGSGDALHFQFGWPGISATYLHGADHNLDFGGSFTFNYGFEGRTVINPGIKLAGVIRLNLMDNGKFNLGLRFDPGIAMYFKNVFRFGLQVPVAFVMGLAVGDAVMINFGMDMPMAIFFTNGTFFVLPFLFGAGVEYHVDSHLSVTLDTRFGPSVVIGGRNSIVGNTDTETEFAFRTLAGIAYHF